VAIEIERKFLLRNDSWKSFADNGVFIRQGYLTGSEKSSVRVRLAGESATLNIKSATLDITRQEYEYSIPPEEAKELLDTLCEGPLIDKYRYHVHHAKHIWEIDVFEGDNRGLVVAEVELDDINQEFEHPEWLGKEVSDDPRYYNVCLVTFPYKDW
jgi:adenylate cyclase